VKVVKLNYVLCQISWKQLAKLRGKSYISLSLPLIIFVYCLLLFLSSFLNLSLSFFLSFSLFLSSLLPILYIFFIFLSLHLSIIYFSLSLTHTHTHSLFLSLSHLTQGLPLPPNLSINFFTLLFTSRPITTCCSSSRISLIG